MSPSLRASWLWLIPVGAVAAGLDVVTGVLLLRAAGGFTGGTKWALGWGPVLSLSLLAFLVLAKTAVRLVETARRESRAEATVAEFSERLLRYWMAGVVVCFGAAARNGGAGFVRRGRGANVANFAQAAWCGGRGAGAGADPGAGDGAGLH